MSEMCLIATIMSIGLQFLFRWVIQITSDSIAEWGSSSWLYVYIPSLGGQNNSPVDMLIVVAS